MPVKTLTSLLSDRVRASRMRSLERREHDRAMSDPRIRDEHYEARYRNSTHGCVQQLLGVGRNGSRYFVR